MVSMHSPFLTRLLAPLRSRCGCVLTFFLPLLWLLFGLLSSPALGATQQEWFIDQAILTGKSLPRHVVLPHVLTPDDFSPSGSRVLYKLSLDLPEAPQVPLAVLIPKLSLSGSVYINGFFVNSCGLGPLEALRCLHTPLFLTTPAGVWRAGDNSIEVEIYASSRQVSGLSSVRVGEVDQLYDQKFRVNQWLKTEFLVALFWVSAVFGFLSLTVYLILSKELAYLWFSLGCLAHMLGLLNMTVTRPWINIEVFSWLVVSSRFFATPMALLTMLSLFDKLRTWMVVALLGFSITGTVLLAFTSVNRPLIALLFVVFLVIGFTLMTMSIFWAFQARSPIKIFTSSMAMLLVFAGIVDWRRFSGSSNFEGSFLFPYVYSVMLLTLGTVLIRSLATSLRQSRVDRAQLERRAAERMAYEITENIPVGTYTVIFTPGEAQGRFLFVSQRFIELTGLNRQDLMNNPNVFAEILHVKAMSDWEGFIRHRLLTRASSSKEFPIFPVGREMRWVNSEAVARTLPDSSVLVEGVLFDRTDVVKAKAESDRIRNELQLRQIEQSRTKEREQLLRDMHDGFGSQLAGVRMMAEKGRIRPEEFPEFLREITADLHLVVDTLGQTNITLQEALVDMHHRLERRFASNGPQLKWDVQLKDLPPLAPRKILQALRLVQEALNNAYKHAHAKNVYFSARFDGQFDLMTLSVRDDGRGLMPPMDRGRGISNMRYRAREMGGVFQLIEHHPGVEVLLRVPRVSAQHQSDSNELVADGHVDRLRL